MKSVISSLVTATLALVTVLGTYKMITYFIKWGREEGGLASQQQDIIPAPGTDQPQYETAFEL